jgi:hypothetical protein
MIIEQLQKALDKFPMPFVLDRHGSRIFDTVEVENGGQRNYEG